MAHKKLKLIFLTISVCLAGLSLSNLTTVASEENIETRLFKRLEYAVKQGRLMQSKQDIKRVLRLNPRHSGATFYAGKFSFKQNDFKNAEKFLRRVENHSVYGPEARRILAEIKLSRYHRTFIEKLKVAIDGQAYVQALELCDKLLTDLPDNKKILFMGTYAATMQGYPDKAEYYLKKYKNSGVSRAKQAELKAFVDGIFSMGSNPEVALEKLFSLTDQRLLTMPVRDKIKDLILTLGNLDKFEEFIEREKSRAGANVAALERELIDFYIQQQQYDKAMELINQRPVDSIEDNLLYLKLLIETEEERKAMLSARSLISQFPSDLRLYDTWTRAWLSYVKRTAEKPQGSDSTGKSFDIMAEEILDRIKLDKLVSLNPPLLLRLLHLAVLTEYDSKAKDARFNAVKIAFNEKNLPLLVDTVGGLIAANRSSIAADLLESARNQLPDNHDLTIKLAEIYFMNNNPEDAAKILENLLIEKPEIIRAFLLWVDCQTIIGNFQEAERQILIRLAQPDINDLVKRQLDNKLEVVRMQSMVQQRPQDYAEESSVASESEEATEQETENTNNIPQAEPESSPEP
jgi:tetratricopeptide (TPR) repeat protein